MLFGPGVLCDAEHFIIAVFTWYEYQTKILTPALKSSFKFTKESLICILSYILYLTLM